MSTHLASARAVRDLPDEPPQTVDFLQTPQTAAFRWFEALFAAMICLLGIWYATHFLSATFRDWDDEGYVLLSLQHYLKGMTLYTQTYTQYGPFFFFSQGFWFRLLRLPLTNDSTRILTLIYWLASAALGGAAIYRFRRNLIVAAAAFAAITLQSSALANEPGHPQQLVLILLAISVFACVRAVPVRPALGLLLMGALGSALVFTKINIGLFYLLALTHALVCLLPAGRLRAIGVISMTMVNSAVPFLLMRTDPIGVGGYCAVATVAAVVTFACGTLLASGRALPLRGILYAGMGALASGAAIVIGALSQGVSIAALIQGVILDPANFPIMFRLPFDVPPAQVMWALAGFCVTGTLTRLAMKGRLDANADWIAGLKCLAGLGAIPFLMAGHPVWALPAVPLVLIFPAGSRRPWFEWLPRIFLADLAVMQFLQAFPIAFSQIPMGSIPALLCALVCLADGCGGMSGVLARMKPLPPAMAAGCVGMLVCGMIVVQAWITYVAPAGFGQPHSQLRGAASLAIDPHVEEGYRYIAERAHANCEVLFTLPGMGSFNFWSEVDTPNALNFTAWVSGFTVEQQQQILQILRARPRACVVYNPDLFHRWKASPQQVAESPLAQYILTGMVKADERNGYQIRVNPGRTAPWVE